MSDIKIFWHNVFLGKFGHCCVLSRGLKWMWILGGCILWQMVSFNLQCYGLDVLNVVMYMKWLDCGRTVTVCISYLNWWHCKPVGWAWDWWYFGVRWGNILTLSFISLMKWRLVRGEPGWECKSGVKKGRSSDVRVCHPLVLGWSSRVWSGWCRY